MCLEGELNKVARESLGKNSHHPMCNGRKKEALGNSCLANKKEKEKKEAI